MTNEELYHHGILGQKWGVRRYQNKDGSLTAAGRKHVNGDSSTKQTDPTKAKIAAIKKANKTDLAKVKQEAKIQNAQRKAEAKIAKAKSKYKYQDPEAREKAKNSSKAISEMSDEELMKFISRKKLENDYKAMLAKDIPAEKVSKGNEFMKTIATSVLIPAATSVGKQYVEKVMKDALGLNKKEAEDSSKALAKLASDYENRQKVDKGQKYFNEGKYKAQAKAEAKSEAKAAKAESKKEAKQSKSDDSSAKAVKGEKWVNKLHAASTNTAPKVKTSSPISNWDVKAHTNWIDIEGARMNDSKKDLYVNQVLKKNEEEFLKQFKRK